MADPFANYLKFGFPKENNSGSAYRTELEYVGPYSTLYSGAPDIGDTWGDYVGRVEDLEIEYLENTSKGSLRVVMGHQFEAGSGGTEAGEVREVSYEVEWVNVNRSMLEHPAFRLGGGGTYELTEEDIAAIEKWKNEDDVTKKSEYKYKESSTSTTYTTLSTNAQKFATGIQQGIESYDDFAPVVRVTTSLVNGGSSTSTAGLKDNPPTFAGGPAGYEWRKSADRSIRTGKQNKWERTEEWLGAKKVLVDRDAIYF